MPSALWPRRSAESRAPHWKPRCRQRSRRARPLRAGRAAWPWSPASRREPRRPEPGSWPTTPLPARRRRPTWERWPTPGDRAASLPHRTRPCRREELVPAARTRGAALRTRLHPDQPDAPGRGPPPSPRSRPCSAAEGWGLPDCGPMTPVRALGRGAPAPEIGRARGPATSLPQLGRSKDIFEHLFDS